MSLQKVIVEGKKVFLDYTRKTFMLGDDDHKKKYLEYVLIGDYERLIADPCFYQSIRDMYKISDVPITLQNGRVNTFRKFLDGLGIRYPSWADFQDNDGLAFCYLVTALKYVNGACLKLLRSRFFFHHVSKDVRTFFVLEKFFMDPEFREFKLFLWEKCLRLDVSDFDGGLGRAYVMYVNGELARYHSQEQMKRKVYLKKYSQFLDEISCDDEIFLDFECLLDFSFKKRCVAVDGDDVDELLHDVILPEKTDVDEEGWDTKSDDGVSFVRKVASDGSMKSSVSRVTFSSDVVDKSSGESTGLSVCSTVSIASTSATSEFSSVYEIKDLPLSDTNDGFDYVDNSSGFGSFQSDAALRSASVVHQELFSYAKPDLFEVPKFLVGYDSSCDRVDREVGEYDENFIVEFGGTLGFMNTLSFRSTIPNPELPVLPDIFRGRDIEELVELARGGSGFCRSFSSVRWLLLLQKVYFLERESKLPVGSYANLNAVHSLNCRHCYRLWFPVEVRPDVREYGAIQVFSEKFVSQLCKSGVICVKSDDTKGKAIDVGTYLDVYCRSELPCEGALAFYDDLSGLSVERVIDLVKSRRFFLLPQMFSEFCVWKIILAARHFSALDLRCGNALDVS